MDDDPEDALMLSSDWAEIRRHAKISLRHMRIMVRNNPDAAAEVDRQLALVENWLPGAPPRGLESRVVVKSVPAGADSNSQTMPIDNSRYETEVHILSGMKVEMYTTEQENPHAVVIKIVRGEIQ